MLEVLLDEARKIARTPKRLLQVLYPRRWRQLFSVLLFNARTGNRWKTAPNESDFKQREYTSYAQYLQHQQSKLKYLDLTVYDVNYRRLLKERLQQPPLPEKCASVLCLGARQGTEVKTFQDLGCFAVGLDLNPGPKNKWVLPGDFHELQFPAESVDVVFTNSFDHAFDPEKLIGEVKRVLKPGGLFIIEAIHGEEQAVAPDHYASFWWRRIDDLIALLVRHDFQAVHRATFSDPWPGEQVRFVKA